MLHEPRESLFAFTACIFRTFPGGDVGRDTTHADDVACGADEWKLHREISRRETVAFDHLFILDGGARFDHLHVVLMQQIGNFPGQQVVIGQSADAFRSTKCPASERICQRVSTGQILDINGGGHPLDELAIGIVAISEATGGSAVGKDIAECELRFHCFKVPEYRNGPRYAPIHCVNATA